MFKKIVFLIVIGCALANVSGCAFGTRRPLLTYDTALSPASKNNITIKVNSFKDERTWSKAKVGDVKNGFGMRCADIIPQNSVTEWVSDALKQELTNAGYTVSDSVEAANMIDGVVMEVYTDAYMNYGGRVRLNIVLKDRSGKTILDKNYEAGENCGLNWAATAASYAKTLEVTLQQVMKSIIDDINVELLN